MLRSCWKKTEKTDRNKLYTGKMDRGIFGIEKEKTVKTHGMQRSFLRKKRKGEERGRYKTGFS